MVITVEIRWLTKFTLIRFRARRDTRKQNGIITTAKKPNRVFMAMSNIKPQKMPKMEEENSCSWIATPMANEMMKNGCQVPKTPQLMRE